MADLNKVFAETVKSAIGGDRKHGWNAKDSLEVIETLIAEEMPQGSAPSEELMGLIAMVVNPSQFRQSLEKEKILDAPEKGTRNSGKPSLSSLLKGF